MGKKNADKFSCRFEEGFPLDEVDLSQCEDVMILERDESSPTNKDLNLVLINPMDSYTPQFTMKNTVPTHLLLLKSYLDVHNNINVGLLDLAHKYSLNNREERVLSLLQRFKDFQLYGIGCFSSNYFLDSIYLAKIIKKLKHDAVVFVGGYHPTVRPQDYIYNDSPIDYIFAGEGEIELNAFVNSFKEGKLPPNPVINTQPLRIEDFVNTDWSIAENLDYVKNPRLNNLVMFSVFLSRGCPFRCAFCCDPTNPNTIAYRKWRRMPMDMAIREVDNIEKRFRGRENLQIEIMIEDPLFGTPTYRVEFYKRLLELKHDLDYWAELRVDTFKPELEVPYAKDLRFSFAFGFESGSIEMLNIMNKTSDPYEYLEQMHVIAQEFDDNEIYLVLNILMGHPGETLELIDESFSYIKDLIGTKKYILPSFSKFMLYPGSEIYSHMDKYERKYGSKFLVKEWWRVPSNQMFLSKLVDPSEGFDCIDVYNRMQEGIRPIFRQVARNVLGKRIDMPLIHRKYKQNFMEQISSWREAPQLFIDFIRNNIHTLLSKGRSREMYDFIKNRMVTLLDDTCPDEFIRFIKNNYPELL